MEFFQVSPRQIYGIHDPIGVKYLSRLRVGLSHLRADKFRHKFADTPSALCDCSNSPPETVEHFLLYCLSHNHRRIELFEKLRYIISLVTLISPTYACDLLLYGNPIYTPDINRKILELTIEFLISSKRFDGPFILND